MKNLILNQNQEELCAKLGMKYDEVSELFGNETLQEMQMAQISGRIAYITGADYYFSEPISYGGTKYDFYYYPTSGYGPNYSGFLLASVIVSSYSPTYGFTVDGIKATSYSIIQNNGKWEFHYTPYSEGGTSDPPFDPSGGY